MSKKRLGVSFGVVIAVAIVLFAFKIVSSVFNAPAQGTISTINATPPSPAGINLTPKPVSGVYASFSYPSRLTKNSTNKIVPPVVAIYNFSYQDIESWNLAVQIIMIPSGQLKDNNGYQVRKINPSTYQESHIVLNNKPIDVMTDKTVGGFSKVAFLINGQYQATISLYGDDANGLDVLQSTLNMVLSTWRWQVV